MSINFQYLYTYSSIISNIGLVFMLASFVSSSCRVKAYRMFLASTCYFVAGNSQLIAVSVGCYDQDYSPSSTIIYYMIAALWFNLGNGRMCDARVEASDA